MNSPLRNAILGGAAALALSVGAAFAAGQNTATTVTATSDNGRSERHVVIVRDGQTVTDNWQEDGPGMGHHGDRHWGHHDPEHAAKRLRDLLQLTPAQEPALQAFLAAMRPHEDGHMGGMEHGPVPADPAARKAEMDRRMADIKAHHAAMEKTRADEAAMTTPQKLDRMVAKIAEESARRQTELRAHVDAVKRFYAALTPSQQKAFDSLHQGMMGGMERGEHDGPSGRMFGRGMHMGEMAPMPPMPPAPPPPPGER